MNQTDYVTVDPRLLKTEERIVQASMKVFAQYPLEDASLRVIAKEAGVTLSLISYHYKSKENLHQVVMRRILAQVEGLLDAKFQELDSGKEITAKAARRHLEDFVDFLAERMFANPNSSLFLKLFFHEHMNPSDGYNELYRDFFKKAVDMLSKMIQVIGKDISDRRAAILAFGIIGQMFGYRLERELMIRHLDIKGYTEDEAKEIRELVLRNALAAIRAEKHFSPRNH